MKLKPNNALLLVEVEPDVQTTKSGIITGYGRIERDKTIWAKVLAVGPGNRIPKGPREGQREPLPVHPGDRVLIPRSAGFLQGDELDPQRELTLVDWYKQVHLAVPGDRGVGEVVAV